MPRTTDSRSGITHDFDTGESGWGDAVNTNFQSLSEINWHLTATSIIKTPPTTPEAGETHIIATGPTGVWQSQTADTVAVYDGTEWRYYEPQMGYRCYIISEQALYAYHTASGWGKVSSVAADTTIYKGIWSADVYTRGNVVFHNNKFYIAKNDRSASDTTAPASDPEWLDMVVSGDTGSGEANVQSDWDETDTANDAFIRNKPVVGTLTGVSGTAPISVDNTTPTTPVVEIADRAITANKIAENSLTAGELAPNSVGSSEIAPNAVSNTKIVDDTIKVAKLDSTNTPTDGQLPTYDATSGGLTWLNTASIYKGSWANPVAYKAGEIVVYDHNHYIAVKDHTSSLSNAPLSGANRRLTWRVLDTTDIDALAANTMGATATDSIAVSKSISSPDVKVSVQSLLNLAPSGGPASLTSTRAVRLKDMTKVGLTLNRADMGMVGDGNSGLIFGGLGGVRTERLGGFVRYVVASDSVTLAVVPTTGSDITVRRGMGMVGTDTAGLIYGGDGTDTNNFFQYVYRSATSDIALLKLSHTGAITDRNDMGMVGSRTQGMIFGGYANATPSNDFWFYTVSQGSVTVGNLDIVGTIPNLYDMGMIGDHESGIIFGGNTGTTESDRFFSYSVAGPNVTVTELTKSGGIPPRSGLGMVGTKTAGIIFGGVAGQTRLNDFWSYLISGDNVTLIQLTNIGDVLSARTDMGMVGSATTGFVFGGFPLNNDFFRYSTTTVSGGGTGGITGVVAGRGLEGGGTSGTVRLDATGSLTESEKAKIALIPNPAPAQELPGESATTFTATQLTKTGTTTGGFQPALIGDAVSGILFDGVIGATTNQTLVRKYVVSGDDITITNLTKAGSDFEFAKSNYAGFGYGDVGAGLIFGWSRILSDVRYRFMKYAVNGNTITFTLLTTSGATLPANFPAGSNSAGNVTSGIIYGGVLQGRNPENRFLKYTVSGNNVDLVYLTKTGDTLPGRQGFGMVGDSSGGIIFGGELPARASPIGDATGYNDFYRYNVTGNTVNTTALTVSGTISARNNFGMVGDISRGFIYGGYLPSGLYSASIFQYRLNGDTVTVSSPTVTGTLGARSHMPMVGDIYTGILFAGRGTRGADLNDFVRYVSNASRATLSSRYGLMNNACVTQAEYDALPVKDANTLYFIVPEPMEGS